MKKMRCKSTFKNSTFCSLRAFTSVCFRFNNLPAMTNPPFYQCLSNQSLYFDVFFYDGPKICISRLCGSNSTPTHPPLHWIHLTVLHSVHSPLAPLSGLGTRLDLTSLTPVNTSLGLIGDVFFSNAFYQAFNCRVDWLLFILESEGKHFFLWCLQPARSGESPTPPH